MIRALLCAIVVLAAFGRVHASPFSSAAVGVVLTKDGSFPGIREAATQLSSSTTLPPSTKPDGSDTAPWTPNQQAGERLTTSERNDSEEEEEPINEAQDNESNPAESAAGDAVELDGEVDDDASQRNSSPGRKHGAIPVRWALINLGVWGLALVSLFGMCVGLVRCSRRARKWILGREQQAGATEILLGHADYSRLQVLQQVPELSINVFDDPSLASAHQADFGPNMLASSFQPSSPRRAYIGLGVARGNLLLGLLGQPIGPVQVHDDEEAALEMEPTSFEGALKEKEMAADDSRGRRLRTNSS